MLPGPAAAVQGVPVGANLKAGLWRGAELFAQYLAFSHGVPACPDCRLACPVANLTCPSCPVANLTCPAPVVQLACPPPPAVNVSCPAVYPLRAEGDVLGFDGASLAIGGITGALGATASRARGGCRRRRAAVEEDADLGELARAQVAQVRRRPALRQA